MAVLIVGAGLSGATLARQLAEAGTSVTVVEARDHVAGNCHTMRDPDTGVMEHVYGPHIFHTDDAQVWDHVSRFARMMPYRHRVRTTAQGQVYTLPVTLHSINQLFGTAMGPEEARAFLASQAEDIPDPQSFEEAALAQMGRRLYEAFFKGYTQKQWGCDPRDLPASILKRLPLRFEYDDSYFAHRYQGIPREGYTAMVTAMLDHPRITLRLNTPYDPAQEGQSGAPWDQEHWEHLFWSGPLDGYFNHALGRLKYRTLRFERFTAAGDYQGCAVMNYADRDVAQTRITEHKHFAPWEQHAGTVVTREYSAAAGAEDIPYYPVRLLADKALLQRYVEAARATQGVTFIGRLGTYRYLDMDAAIHEALQVAEAYLGAQHSDAAMPAFVVEPL
ncbi:UDP-galactopyranose mutase [Thalassobius sp. Cn5-15]|uniref:UDP-galactopyranose mutase n=1 Tax=Thalassobius sp. Cn5-15 TaxID=2917763 RepID=UPI001EF3D305|nr:UDP-galactopyranose mutase [Thalassobius sp. Cn5-15]MCG7494970.1 UDP-galactopyranose mutase [Thalassobius sp. Cn5-15]